MDPEAILKVENYDLRKLSKTCNYGDCKKLPSKEIIIVEEQNRMSRELVAIYFCEEHHNRNINTVLEKLKAASQGKVEKRVSDIGYMTY